jgi:Spy/CpxP family protein refolding chaperone
LEDKNEKHHIKEIKMKKITTLFLVLTGFFMFSTGVAAQSRMHFSKNKNMRRPAQGRLLTLLQAKQDELKITDEQIQKIKDHTFAMEEKAVQQRNSMNLLRLEQKKFMQDIKNRDYTKIKALLSQSSENRVNNFISRLKAQEEIRNILTPEQREAVKELAKNRFQRQRPQFQSRFQRQPTRDFHRRFRR